MRRSCWALAGLALLLIVPRVAVVPSDASNDALDGNVAGQVVYDLVVFPTGPGRPLMYRVVMDVGLAQGQIIKLSQSSMTRIDPGAIGDAV